MDKLDKIRALIINTLRSAPAFGIYFVMLWDLTWNDFSSFLHPLNLSGDTLFELAIIFGLSMYAIIGFRSMRETDTIFSTDTDLRTAVEDVIHEAQKRLYLISPYLDPGNLLVESVLGARRRGAKVTMIYNSHQVVKPKLASELNRLIAGGVKVYTHPRLHSKIYINESDVLICSLNLVAGSYTESFESGVHTGDYDIIDEAVWSQTNSVHLI